MFQICWNVRAGFFIFMNTTIATLTKGQLEDKISKKIIEFYVSSIGTGPREARAYIVEDMILVRLKGKLLPIEEQLLGSGTQGIELVKNIQRSFHEINTAKLRQMIEEMTGHKVISSHSDVSTKTGEKFNAFIMDTDFNEEFKKNSW